MKLFLDDNRKIGKKKRNKCNRILLNSRYSFRKG